MRKKHGCWRRRTCTCRSMVPTTPPEPDRRTYACNFSSSGRSSDQIWADAMTWRPGVCLTLSSSVHSQFHEKCYSFYRLCVRCWSNLYPLHHRVHVHKGFAQGLGHIYDFMSALSFYATYLSNATVLLSPTVLLGIISTKLVAPPVTVWTSALLSPCLWRTLRPGYLIYFTYIAHITPMVDI